MADPIPGDIRQFVSLAGPASDATQRDMEAHAEDASFPVIGPEAGGILLALAEATGAGRVFEFGSGFGYSATWFARGMDEDGEIILVEVDADELELATEFLDDAGYAPTFRYEPGDAVEVIERYDGPFDIVLVDHDKVRYVDGFERVRGKVAPGGIVVADNMMRGPAPFEDVLAGLAGEPAGDERTAGIVDYLGRVRADPDFVTVVLPVGSGLALSVRRR